MALAAQAGPALAVAERCIRSVAELEGCTQGLAEELGHSSGESAASSRIALVAGQEPVPTDLGHSCECSAASRCFVLVVGQEPAVAESGCNSESSGALERVALVAEQAASVVLGDSCSWLAGVSHTELAAEQMPAAAEVEHRHFAEPAVVLAALVSPVQATSCSIAPEPTRPSCLR